jgi:hypothetical protein
MNVMYLNSEISITFEMQLNGTVFKISLQMMN